MENVMIKLSSIVIQSIFALYHFVSITNYFKQTKEKNYLTSILIVIIICITQILDLKNYNLFLLIFLLVLTLKFTSKLTLLKSILSTILYCIIISISGLISLKIINLNIYEDLLIIPNKYIIFLVLQLIINISIELLINIFLARKHKINSYENTTNSTINNKIKLIIFLILAYTIPQIIVIFFLKYTYPLPLIVLEIFKTILVCILIFSYFDIINKDEKIQTNLSTIELHNKTLIELVDGVRTLKHDYGNIIQALNGYVVTKQYNKLKEYIDSLIKEFCNVNNISAIDPNIFNDPAIYGVVGAKYFYAIENDITFDLDITSDIKNINFSKPELSRILGILLDNAIEATLKCNNKYIKLDIHFDDKKYADVIRVINTYDTSEKIDLDKIYEKGVSSKEIKSGIGLWEAKKLISKNKHSQIYATIEKEKFIQNLIIEKAD